MLEFASARRVIARTLLLMLGPMALGAQTTVPTPVFSIGQPPLTQYDAALVAPQHGFANGSAPLASVSIHRPIINPVAGLLGATAEGYAAVNGHGGGVRLFVETKALALSEGIDWSLSERRATPIISYESAIRRGGLIGHGSMLRIDWLPFRSQSLAVGVTMPLFRPLAGRTRPAATAVRLSDVTTDRGIREAAHRSTPPANSSLRAIATALGAFSNAYSTRAEGMIAHTPRDYAATMRNYDSAILELFRQNGTDSVTARRAEDRAREALLEHVVLPLDSLFGQAKTNPRDLSPLTRSAAVAFGRWLADSAKISESSRSKLADGFATWLDVVTGVYEQLLSDAGDSRLVWLPLDLALRPDQFDEQAEVDSLIARGVGHPFTDQNALTYLRSTDLPLEIARSIDAARSYHVLWTHDFTGFRPSGAVDNVAYSMVADAYLPAMTAAVKRYDSTGVFPVYMILQDEFFYEPRGNRLWMNVLENPLHASMGLPGDGGEREAHLRARQQELRAAVAASKRLQAEAALSGNAERWLANTIKVHVNIVEPSDFSFRSSHTIPGVPFTPDNIMRDHRKIVFYDLTEADPYKGAMLLMGIGIGEHYTSATWEDRGYRIRGPATLEARRAVREVLLRNGFTQAEIPEPLRAVTGVRATEQRDNIEDYVGRALQVHNHVGFGPKESSVARAMLYDLAPPGSVIIVPDPMWLSDTWAGMLAAAAARGCRVYIVAPAEANAPSPQGPLMAVQRAVLERLLRLRQTLGPQIRAAGGDLRIGMFAAKANADDAAGRIREVREGLVRAPWILDVIPFDAQTLGILQRTEQAIAARPNATALARDEKPRAPQLHQKSQLIARPGAIAALLRQPGWDVVLGQTMRGQADETARFAEQLGYTNPDVDTTATRRNDARIRGYEQTLSESDRRRVSFYFSVGTQNEDPRGIVSDGEATLIVSGVEASAGLADLFYLMARSNWISTDRELDQFIRPRSGLLAKIAWFIRAAF